MTTHHRSRRLTSNLTLALSLLLLMSCARETTTAGPTPEDARAFMDQAEKQLRALSIESSRAGWVQSNFITGDTELLAAKANEKLIAATTQWALEARRFDGLALPEELQRKFKLLRLSLTLPAPNNDAEREELTQLAAGLEADYGRGKYCPKPGECLSVDDIGLRMAKSRNAAELLDLWRGWHDVARPMRDRYARFVELSNKGAREIGFADTGAMWRSNYDMEPDAFTADVERLWQQVKPLYLSLHTYVRAKMIAQYGDAASRPDGTIPAHLLGNMWAQQWGNIYPLVAPPNAARAVDLTRLLEARKVDALGMARFGEGFFVSLGLPKLPDTFWERSLFTRPRDRDVVCHASAWHIDADLDVRIKMCINITSEDFTVVHHELGHDYYYLAYRTQPYLFQSGANDGFHEAVGDTIALSVTPEYLKQIGLLQTVPPVEADLGLLMQTALDKIAFLPFGLLIDQWRWKVFSGEVTPANYNQAWWNLRREYQGVSAPVDRTETDFDPGAKYHVPGNTPYTRYFLAHVLQFQMHRALCRAAGVTGPLHRCSIYDNKAAGDQLWKMLGMGQSRPWPDALDALSGERQLDASAMVEYFQPLLTWLDEQNKGKTVGWKEPTE